MSDACCTFTAGVLRKLLWDRGLHVDVTGVMSEFVLHIADDFAVEEVHDSLGA